MAAVASGAAALNFVKTFILIAACFAVVPDGLSRGVGLGSGGGGLLADLDQPQTRADYRTPTAGAACCV
ncbi:MAG: hypothetical protein A3F68_02875 [Acidobacteria bacterium RIFCSPLOWO2_12_FULL_54_10]|nr:MAG: hypothetical protein A3F68_02875 [Acidobacteria bacterium RIFCSPLOWO2_12_FULL_54_10]